MLAYTILLDESRRKGGQVTCDHVVKGAILQEVAQWIVLIASSKEQMNVIGFVN